MWWIKGLAMKTRLQTSHKRFVFGTAILGAALLSGCMTQGDSYPPMAMRNTVQIAESIERLELYARPDGLVLSARDEMAVGHFLQAYGQHGDGPIYINVPSGQSTAQGVTQTQGLIRRLLSQGGMGGAQIETGQYQTAMNRAAPTVVSYRRLKTIPQDCRHLGNMTNTYTNQPFDGFGCAFSANLAAMIEDPRQLLEPYALSPQDMKRRMQVYDKYILGENPASEHPDRQDISADDE